MHTRHQLLERVSQTAESVVWRARHADTGELIALKTQRRPPPPALLTLRHENVVPVLEIHPPDSSASWITIMPWITGEPLAKKLDAPAMDALVRQSLAGLAAIHDVGVLHLDLKPDNLLIAECGLRIADFSSARLMSEAKADLHGSVHYMAPECFEGGMLDARTDLYALGCVFYFALTGKTAFEGELAPQVITAHLQHRFEPLPGPLGAWISRLVSRHASDRPATARAALLECSELEHEVQATE